jgi:hypothetical protein
VPVFEWFACKSESASLSLFCSFHRRSGCRTDEKMCRCLSVLLARVIPRHFPCFVGSKVGHTDWLKNRQDLSVFECFARKSDSAPLSLFRSLLTMYGCMVD